MGLLPSVALSSPTQWAKRRVDRVTGVGWRNWRGWDSLDRLDYRTGFRRDRSPQEEARALRGLRLVLVTPGVVLVAIYVANGAYVHALVDFGLSASCWLVLGWRARCIERHEGF